MDVYNSLLTNNGGYEKNMRNFRVFGMLYAYTITIWITLVVFNGGWKGMISVPIIALTVWWCLPILQVGIDFKNVAWSHSKPATSLLKVLVVSEKVAPGCWRTVDRLWIDDDTQQLWDFDKALAICERGVDQGFAELKKQRAWPYMPMVRMSQKYAEQIASAGAKPIERLDVVQRPA